MPQDGACGHLPHRGGIPPQFFTGEDADGSRETRILGVLPQQETKQDRLGCINHRTGYGYENAKANVMMDYKGWFMVRSKKVR